MKSSAEYRRLLAKTRTLLSADVPPCDARAQALADFAAMLADAEARQVPADTLFPDGYDTFYRDLLASLPARTAEEIYAVHRRRRGMLITAAAGLLVGIILATLIASGQMGIWVRGLGYVAYTPEKYQYNSFALDLYQYSLTVNLSQLDSAIGRAIYAQDEGKITFSGGNYAQGWRVGFRSHGEYSAKGATLVTAQVHAPDDMEIFYTYPLDVSAKLTVTWNGQAYPCSIMGASGIHYRDGDDFFFYLPEEIPPDAGEVTLTLTNLAINRWSRKP